MTRFIETPDDALLSPAAFIDGWALLAPKAGEVPTVDESGTTVTDTETIAAVEVAAAAHSPVPSNRDSITIS